MKKYPLKSPYVLGRSQEERMFKEFILVCFLTECPFNRLLTSTPDGSFALISEHRSREEGMPVCSALREAWNPSLVPENCPIRKGQITPWNREGENLLYRLLGETGESTS